MKRLFRSAIALAALAFAGAAAAPAAAQTPPDVLVVGQIAEPQSLDPHTVTATNDFRILVNVYDGLVRFKDGTLEVEPALAESWKISDDGKTYTFTLRQGVKFHDGSNFDAEAVKFNFDRMLKKDHPFYNTGPFPLSFNFVSVEAVNVLDEHTVEFKLSEAFAPFLSNLAYPTGLIVSPVAVEKHGREYGRSPSGTGPFKFVEWLSNQRVVVERNPDYWDGAAKLQAVVFRPITDANTRVAEMMAGGIDVMVEVPPDNLATFEQDANFAVAEQAGPHVWFTILNTKEGPFADKRVRQAANYAVNKQTLVDDVLQGTATVAAGPIPPAFNWVESSVEPYAHDPEKAKALLAEAGVANPQVTFYVTEGGSGMLDPITMGAAIQADLQAVGFKVKIETYEWNTFLGRVNPGLEGKADMAEMAWMTNDPDTVPYLTLRTDAMPDKGGFNSGYYSNPQLDELLEKARRSTDQAERGKLYGEVQSIVHDDAPWLFVANWKQNAVTTAAVKGFKLQPSFLLDLHGVTKE
ncbi:ABC transporter substrate-binding protein [Sinorhizobium meliloti]|uniref:ABC transporter substrate-binding protein n=1 Tax=Rhizobium meliloti TaxID=382 RepID=UPI001295A000|nr:ABC transporter substrate-binding protein [Sinorhizobium meliloti]MDW9428213.1 ABC transporter substrate-binding protein [Sinorhizobium meliloti]MQV82513.1 ABC transporter substrate-binding protein [Sinorhizobium meliloti]